MSLLATILAATETAAHGEESKTLFYVLGLVAAGWAVAVSLVGLASANFPRSDGLARVLMLVSLLVAGGAIGGAIVTA